MVRLDPDFCRCRLELEDCVRKLPATFGPRMLDPEFCARRFDPEVFCFVPGLEDSDDNLTVPDLVLVGLL